MRISRQTSGGRGEYEIAENYRNIKPVDLLEKRIILDFGDGLQVDTNVVLRRSRTQGKRRLRLLDERRDIQIPRQVAAALLLPKPVRGREALGAGQPVLISKRYAIEDIELQSVNRAASTATMTLRDIAVGNQSHQAEMIPFDRRLQQVRRVWAEKASFSPAISALLDEHERLVKGGGPVPERAEQIVDELQRTLADESTDLGITYIGTMDVLPALEESLGGIADEPVIQVDDIDAEDIELRQRAVSDARKWAASRGNKSAVFRRKVRAAYNATCIVCGERYPPTAANRKPGVDAAHILPWAQYDLDEVFNGLCLCKNHHWAFDEGLIEIVHEAGKYLIRIPDAVRNAIGLEPFSLDALSRCVGEIPTDRLPTDTSHRPRPQLLQKLREATQGVR